MKRAVAIYKKAGEEAGSEGDGEEPDGVILDHLGDVYDKLGQTDPAIEAWTAALAAFEKGSRQENGRQGPRQADQPDGRT